MSGLQATTLDRRLSHHLKHDPNGLTTQVIGKLLRPASQLTADSSSSDLLDRLRSMAPVRPLATGEAMVLAERQAQRLRSELGIISPRFDDKTIGKLDWLKVKRRAGFPTSGMATKVGHHWVVVIRSDEAMVRQRFTLAHELKHIIDDEAVSAMTSKHLALYPAARGFTPTEQAERVADRFAAALLMPRPLLRADWADGIQDIARLSRRYGVSHQAMTFRLTQLGLLQRTARCPKPDTRQGGM